jgi:phenylalanyl-tRNA synthetase beta chain
VRAPLGWLRDYIDIQLEPEQLAGRLTILGMEVRGIERFGADWRSVVVGQLLTVEKHPRADRLSLTTVDVGNGQVLEIVCGATNIAPGQRVPVALPGAVLPGGRAIERAEKMGVVSNGMLCSGDELNLTSDADGILILPPDAPLGTELTALYGDTVLDVDVKPNRGDALSLVGLAREISIVTGSPVRFPDCSVTEQGAPARERVSVMVAEPGLCSRFVARWLSGVRVGPAPNLIQVRLQAAGMRPISNVVDASNYVMLELGKPTHAFDAAAVHEQRLIVRRAAAGERLETLDHVARELTQDDLVVADPAGVLGIAGIMGGAASEVSEQTTEVIVESAIFDPVAIRRTGQRYALRSEASLRFEKGQEFRLARLGADRVARLIGEWAGATIAPGVVDTAAREMEPVRLAFRPARINRLLGTSLGGSEQASLLGRAGITSHPTAGFGPVAVVVSGEPKPLTVQADSGDVIVATIPTWRSDLAIEADLAEEIARVIGYETIPPILPDTVMPDYLESPLGARNLVRETLAGAGLTEVVTAALTAPRAIEQFSAPAAPPRVLPGDDPPTGRLIRAVNPLSAEHAVLRQGLLSSLLEVLVTNLRQGRADVAIFEIGKGYGYDEAAGAIHEWWRLGFALLGEIRPAAWDRPAEDWQVADAKGLVELLAARLRLERPAWRPLADDPAFHPGRSALLDGPGTTITGRVGELHPALAAELDVRAGHVVIGELAVPGLAGGAEPGTRVHQVPRFQPVERDLAVVVDQSRPAAAVEEVIRSAAGELLRSVRLFDLYRGAPLAPAEQSLNWRLIFQADDRPLAESEVDARMNQVADHLATEVGGRIRT